MKHDYGRRIYSIEEVKHAQSSLDCYDPQDLYWSSSDGQQDLKIALELDLEPDWLEEPMMNHSEDSKAISI